MAILTFPAFNTTNLASQLAELRARTLHDFFTHDLQYGSCLGAVLSVNGLVHADNKVALISATMQRAPVDGDIIVTTTANDQVRAYFIFDVEKKAYPKNAYEMHAVIWSAPLRGCGAGAVDSPVISMPNMAAATA